MFNLSEIGYFVGLGVIGAIAYILIKSDEWDDLTSFDAFKRYGLGAISGFIYQLLYSSYDFPNSMMCIASGYLGTDFILGLMKRFNPTKK